MFRDREEAGRLLGKALTSRVLRHPLVLAIPRGGVIVGAAIARELNADLDVVLSRKLRAPNHPEFALGALAEDGSIYLNPQAQGLELPEAYLETERQEQIAEVLRRKQLIRSVLPAAPVMGRSVIITDDGLATGSTMLAALQVLKAQQPHEVMVALPVAPNAALQKLRDACQEVICLDRPAFFSAVGQFYEDFRQVEDDEFLELLKSWTTRVARFPE